MKRIIFLSLFLILPFLFSSTAFAQPSTNSYITIVNPQRISSYNKNYLESFREEWSQVQRRGLPATWLVTYDVLEKKDFVADLKKLDTRQELGIFLEVTPNFAKAANVSYNQTSSWHYASSLFLSGYTQKARKQLIDTVFQKFKKTFGYYPVSVGAWWVDSYSLAYMKETYHITGVLGVSDQYDLDNYQVWGTWWSVPYYPSALHAGLPAQTLRDKLDVVTFRWAPRDPLHGYKSPSAYGASLYSLQDYKTINLPSSYFNRLLEVYALQQNGNVFGQATIGSEGDLSIETYQNQFSEQLDVVQNLTDRQMVHVTTMKDFSSWYRSSFPNLSPDHLIASSDLLGNTHHIAIWKQTPFYRAGITYDPNTKLTQIIDLRSYPSNFKEPNFLSPNKQLGLSINHPFIIDSLISPSSARNLDLGALRTITGSGITFEKGDLQFLPDKIKIADKVITLKHDFPVPPDGLSYKSSSLTIPFTLKRRFPFLPSSIPFFGSSTYSISQTEYDALTVLKRLPTGNVLSYDKDCLKCGFTGQYKPAAVAGKKAYIHTYSNKPVVIDISFLLARSSTDARRILKDKNIRYVYLAHYEDFSETLPYLPQDLGLKKIYQNANAEIWEVK